MSAAHDEPAVLWHRVQQAAPALQALSLEARATHIARAAAALLRDPALPAALAHSAELSAPVAALGLHTTLRELTTEALLTLAYARKPQAPERAVALVLAGNVFTAAARPMLLPLLVGAPVLAKASSRDDAFPHALARALAAAHPALGAACAVTTFAHDDDARLSALLAQASAVHVLGSDEAVAAIRAHAPHAARVIGRGHGLGLSVLGAEALASTTAAARAAESLALDLCAYDQRGCLSPQAGFAAQGAHVSPEAFARTLFEAVTALEVRLPRGPLPAAAAAAQLQWRAVAAVRGELHESPTCAISYEADCEPRLTPSYRNLSVYAYASLDALRARIARFTPHLKALGLAPFDTLAPELRALAPYTCALGTMQTPPLHAPLDGLHPLEGFTTPST